MLLLNNSSRTSHHILLVEDDMLVHKIHRKKLEGLGYTVSSAKTGKEALAMYSNKIYKHILLDWGLPDVDGLEVCAHIRRHEQLNQLPRVPIVMITAYSYTMDMQQECISAGVDKIIMKPIIDDEAWIALLENHDGLAV